MTGIDVDASRQGAIDYIAEEEAERFRGLRRTHRSFVFPMAVFFLLWFFAYVILAGWAPEFMAIPVWGSINVGLLLGLGQFVTTFAITMTYVSFANRKMDPVAADIRADLEKKEAGA